ncbi:MAG: Rrf2 family transcriptional regulator [Candidatus Firestonebacteria bacterium]
MRISFKGDYALKTLLDLALNIEKGAVKISDIAKRQDIPLKYLEQILLQLKGAGYVNSKRGQDGGYFLTKPSGKITLGEIVRLTEGYTSPITCVSKTCYTKCTDEARCPFKGTWQKVRDAVNEIVDKTTIEDIVKKSRAKESEIYYI